MKRETARILAGEYRIGDHLKQGSREQWGGDAAIPSPDRNLMPRGAARGGDPNREDGETAGSAAFVRKPDQALYRERAAAAPLRERKLVLTISAALRRLPGVQFRHARIGRSQGRVEGECGAIMPIGGPMEEEDGSELTAVRIHQDGFGIEPQRIENDTGAPFGLSGEGAGRDRGIPIEQGHHQIARGSPLGLQSGDCRRRGSDLEAVRTDMRTNRLLRGVETGCGGGEIVRMRDDRQAGQAKQDKRSEHFRPPFRAVERDSGLTIAFLFCTAIFEQ